MNERNTIEAADGTARIKLSTLGHETMDEFMASYARKVTKTYSDIFIGQLNDAAINGVIKSKITEIISLCRRAGRSGHGKGDPCGGVHRDRQKRLYRRLCV